VRVVTFSFSVSGDDIRELFDDAEREIKSLIGADDEDGDQYLNRYSVSYEMSVRRTEESEDEPLHLEASGEYIGQVTARIKDVR
jgi:hypothetical protein